jgi:hypothetical protein
VISDRGPEAGRPAARPDTLAVRNNIAVAMAGQGIMLVRRLGSGICWPADADAGSRPPGHVADFLLNENLERRKDALKRLGQSLDG